MQSLAVLDLPQQQGRQTDISKSKEGREAWSSDADHHAAYLSEDVVGHDCGCGKDGSRSCRHAGTQDCHNCPATKELKLQASRGSGSSSCKKAWFASGLQALEKCGIDAEGVPYGCCIQAFVLLLLVQRQCGP